MQGKALPMAHILCIVLLCFIWQCNNKTTDPQSPPPAPSPNDSSGDECPLLVLDAFEQHIQPAIDASCSAGDCHGDDSNPPGGGLELLLQENSDTATINRAKMRAHRNKWLIGDGVLLDKISDKTHGGGDQVAAGHLTEEGITAWVEAEKVCSRS